MEMLEYMSLTMFGLDTFITPKETEWFYYYGYDGKTIIPL